MNIRFEPVLTPFEDEARLVYVDDRLVAVITLHGPNPDVGGSVHVEAYFKGDAPKMFESLEAMKKWMLAAN